MTRVAAVPPKGFITPIWPAPVAVQTSFLSEVAATARKPELASNDNCLPATAGVELRGSAPL